MPTFENIEGDKLFDLFNELIKKQTLVKTSLPNSNFESLTVLTDTKFDGRIHCFQIDLPDGLMAAMSDSPPDMISFEFTGDDQLTHRFDAALHGISEDSIWLISPTTIQRYQMRSNFRIKVLGNSFGTIEINDIRLRLEIDNLSVGGVYCYCPNKYKSLLETHPRLEHLELNITAKNTCFTVHVDKLLVNRIEPWMRPNHFGVAFEFIQIPKEIRRRLIQHIYDLQREFLQNRLKWNV